MMPQLEIKPNALKNDVNLVVKNINTLETVSNNIKVDFKKNSLKSLTNVKNSSDKFKTNLKKFNQSFVKNLNELTKGIEGLENLDKEISNALKASEKNSKKREGGF